MAVGLIIWVIISIVGSILIMFGFARNSNKQNATTKLKETLKSFSELSNEYNSIKKNGVKNERFADIVNNHILSIEREIFDGHRIHFELSKTKNASKEDIQQLSEINNKIIKVLGFISAVNELSEMEK